jgi:hypothetical protein
MSAFIGQEQRTRAEASLAQVFRYIHAASTAQIIDFVTGLGGKVTIEGRYVANVEIPTPGGRDKSVRSHYTHGGSPESVEGRLRRSLVDAWARVLAEAEATEQTAEINRVLARPVVGALVTA